MSYNSVKRDPIMALMGEVLYRKYRPQSFAEVAGQDAVTRTLRNSVASGRLSHAYLLCGPRGTGKTSLGRLLAKAANCAAPVEGEPCNRCASCVGFVEGRALDFIEQDAASHNGVEDIRQLRENVILTPMEGTRKVYLLDEVHMLSASAENALLKTLEEPPPHIIFVLATTEAHKIASTIVSRCQRFDLKRIPMNAAVDRLAFIAENEGFTLDRSALEDIARATTGSLRDAVNALEQVVTYYGRSPSSEQVREALGLTVDARSGQLARLALNGDLPGGLRLIAEVKDDGVDMKQFSKQVVRYLRGLLLAKAGASEALDLPAETAAEVQAQARNVPRDDILRALQTFARIDWREDTSSLPLELALVDLISQSPKPAAQRAEPVAPMQRPREPDRPARTAEAPSVERVVTPEPQTTPPPELHVDEPPAVERVSTEPVPSTAAPPAANGSGGDDLLDRVRLALKDTDKNLAALLNGSCEVKSTTADTVVLGFYHTFHLERVESGTFRPTLEKAFSSCLGHPVTITFEHAPRQAKSEGPKKGGHLVQAARELGARAVPPED